MSLQIDFSQRHTTYKTSLLQQLSLVCKNCSILRGYHMERTSPGEKETRCLVQIQPRCHGTILGREFWFPHLSPILQFKDSLIPLSIPIWHRGGKDCQISKTRHKPTGNYSVFCYPNIFWVLWQLPKGLIKTYRSRVGDVAQ